MVNTLHNDFLGTETRCCQTPSHRTRAIEGRNDKMPLIRMHGGAHAKAYARNMQRPQWEKPGDHDHIVQKFLATL